MSIPHAQTQLLRTTFQSCRPRSSLHIRGSSRLLLQQQQTRHHSNDTTAPFKPSVSSSVSQDEVSHFSQLASSWWDPYGPSRLLHLMNPLRHDFISNCLESDPSYDGNAKQKYLDIGCGGGIFASSAARKPHTQSVTAIDPTPEVIAVAKSQQRSDPGLAEPKLTYLNCAIEDLETHTHTQPYTHVSSQTTEPNTQDGVKRATGQYDIISLFEVIEHIDDPSSFLQTALTHLKPGGWLIGSTISRHPISYITTKLIAEAPLVGIVPRGTHDWNKYINPAELRAWFEKQRTQPRDGIDAGNETVENNFGPVRIEGVVYVPVLGWKFIKGSADIGNYFFGVQKLRLN